MAPDPFLKKSIASKLFCLEEGQKDGVPVLLLHGITGSHRYWSFFRKKLGKDYHLFIPDLLGFGSSPKPHIHYSVDVFRDSIRNLIVSKSLDRRKMVFIGHSLGAIIAAEYALAYPEQVSRIVLLSLPVYPDAAIAHRIFLKGSASYRNLLAANNLYENLTQIRRSGFHMSLMYLSKIPVPVIVDSRKFTFRSLTSTLENCLLKYNAERLLSQLSHFPALALHGEKDQVSPVSGMIELSKKLPNVSLKVIRNSGHHIVLTHPSECLSEIENFLACP